MKPYAWMSLAVLMVTACVDADSCKLDQYPCSDDYDCSRGDICEWSTDGHSFSTCVDAQLCDTVDDCALDQVCEQRDPGDPPSNPFDPNRPGKRVCVSSSSGTGGSGTGGAAAGGGGAGGAEAGGGGIAGGGGL